MPSLSISAKAPRPSKGKDQRIPIAIIKGDDDRLHNKFLVLNTAERPPPGKKETYKVELPFDSLFSVLPPNDPEKRAIWYVAGASGAGKSYMARQIANNYQRMYPDRPVYLVSKLDYDETLDKMENPPIRLDYKEWVESPPDINEFANCLVIFDDFDTIEGKEGKAVQTMIDDLAIMGRRHHDGQGNVSMLVLSHYLTNYKKTRLILSESHYYIVYPQSTSAHALGYMLRTHLGLDKDDIRGLRKLGRWVLFHKGYPQYQMSSQTCRILHMGDD